MRPGRVRTCSLNPKTPGPSGSKWGKSSDRARGDRKRRVRNTNVGESAARVRALLFLQSSLGSTMAKALREKAVETASYRTTIPLNRPSKGRPIGNPSPVNRARPGRRVDLRLRVCLYRSHCERDVLHRCRAPANGRLREQRYQLCYARLDDIVCREKPRHHIARKPRLQSILFRLGNRRNPVALLRASRRLVRKKSPADPGEQLLRLPRSRRRRGAGGPAA